MSCNIFLFYLEILKATTWRACFLVHRLQPTQSSKLPCLAKGFYLRIYSWQGPFDSFILLEFIFPLWKAKRKFSNITRSESKRWDDSDHWDIDSFTLLMNACWKCTSVSQKSTHSNILHLSLQPRDVMRVLVKSFIFKTAFIVIGIYICCVGKFMYPSVWCKAVRNKWIVRAECCVSGWNMSLHCSWLHNGVSFIKMNARHKGQSEAHHSVLAVKPCMGEMTDSVI